MVYLRSNTIIKIGFATIAVLLLLSGFSFAQERVSVKSNVANIRADAKTSSDVLWQVEKYHPFLIVVKKGKWVKVRDFENDEAWIHTSLLGNEKSVITIKDKCNIRTKPTTKSSVMFTAERGVPFKYLKKEGNWIKIKHSDGDVGWIFKKLVW